MVHDFERILVGWTSEERMEELTISMGLFIACISTRQKMADANYTNRSPSTSDQSTDIHCLYRHPWEVAV
jgi:hypothetical protein